MTIHNNNNIPRQHHRVVFESRESKESRHKPIVRETSQSRISNHFQFRLDRRRANNFYSLTDCRKSVLTNHVLYQFFRVYNNFYILLLYSKTTLIMVTWVIRNLFGNAHISYSYKYKVKSSVSH